MKTFKHKNRNYINLKEINKIGLKLKTEIFIYLFKLFLISFPVIVTGCNNNVSPSDVVIEQEEETDAMLVYKEYLPLQIDILPLTEFIVDEAQGVKINLFVSLLDSYDSQVKSPCIFRFELYQKVQLSAESKGKRVMIWPDIDLYNPQDNNKYWRNFLRAYEFSLPFQLQNDQPYILEVTCLCPNNKRLSSEFTLKTKNVSFD